MPESPVPQGPAEALAAMDPYTRFEPAALQELGYTATAPFALGDGHGTQHVERELGLSAVCWIETGHFRIGSTLQQREMPDDTLARRLLAAELRELRGRLPRLPTSPRAIDPWLHVHLFALRLERLYEDFAARSGAPPGQDGRGPHLGCRDKFVVLLFERESDLCRYLRRFCDSRADAPCTLRFPGRDALLLATAAGCERGRLADAHRLHGHVLHHTVQNFVRAAAGADAGVPVWWSTGLAHWFLRRLDPRLVEARRPEPSPPWDPEAWPAKVRARVRNETVPDLREVLHWSSAQGRGEADHAVLWSLADFLMDRGDAAFARFLQFLREHPLRSRFMPQKLVLAWHEHALAGAYGLDIEGLAREWRQFVIRSYRGEDR